MTHYLLVLSSFLLLLNCALIRNQLLSALLLANFATSIAFWMNPIQKSFLHTVDSFFAKLSLVAFTVYMMFIKGATSRHRFVYVLVLSFTGIMAFFSNIFSRSEWTCSGHILCHFVFHIFSNIGLFVISS
jgi:hypothetical protein